MAVLPEIRPQSEAVTIDDIQVGDPDVPLTEDQQELISLIWDSRHLLIGRGNALPPAARGAICDIDVGNASPIAQRVRPVAPSIVKNYLTWSKAYYLRGYFDNQRHLGPHL